MTIPDAKRGWQAYRVLPHLVLALIFLLALAVRVVFIKHFPIDWYGDQKSQYNSAILISQGLYFGYRDPYWPPGSIVMSGIVMTLFHGSVRAVQYTQALLGAVTVLFMHAIGRRFFGQLAGLLAALLYAIYVPFIYYTGTFLSETTFFFFTLAAIAMLGRYLDTNAQRDLICTGILFALSALSRPVSLPLPILAFFLFWLHKNGLHGWPKLLHAAKTTFVLLLVMVITISPWTIRNWVVVHDPVFIDFNGGINMYIAHNKAATGYWMQLPLDDPALKGQHTPEGEKLAQQNGVNYVISHPSETLQQFGKVHHIFWTKEDVDVDKKGQVIDRILGRLHLPALHFQDIKWWTLLIGLLAVLFRPRKSLYLVLFILAYNIVIDFLYFAPRYRMVIEPFLILLLAGGLQVLIDWCMKWVRKPKTST